MKASRRKSKRDLRLTILNITIVAAMLITLAMYARANAQEEDANNRSALVKSTANVSDSVSLYFISQYRNLYNHHCYISPPDGDSLTYEEAVAYLRKANSDPMVNYQLIDASTYCGESLINGSTVTVDYTHETYLSIREACDIVASGAVQHDIISSTSVFANASKGAVSSVALYTDIIVETGGRDKRYALFAVIGVGDLVYSGLPNLPYKDAGACIIDKNGDYIVKDDVCFRNSENFWKFLRIYNELSFPQMFKISEDMKQDGAGILEYKNYRGERCFYSYDSVDGTDGWYYVASVPVDSMLDSNFDFIFTVILLLFLGALIIINGLWMKRLNTLLKNNISSLDEARISADAANKAKTVFLAHMSHEMRTPLNAIIGMSTLAQERSDDPEIESLMTKMLSASEHLLGIINDVLDMSKIGEGKLTLHYEPFSIEEMNTVLSTIYNINAGKKGISLLFESDIEIDRYIIGDQLRLRQVMTNLISNAIKYNNQGGFVKVSVRQLGPIRNDAVRILFQVEDNGFGISEDKQKDIFEPFSRDYTDRTKAIAGTGLGLAISSQFVRAMGGEIELESRLGVGSRFYFDLEFKLGEKITAKADTVKPHWDSRSLEGLRVLIAEDNEMNTYIIENLVRRVGAQTETASNGKQALEMVKNNPDGYFDVVLMDILMPVMDGYGATRLIKQLDSDYAKNLPIVALSANAFIEDIETSLSHGMLAHLAKPINIDELYQTVVDLTRKPSSI